MAGERAIMRRWDAIEREIVEAARRGLVSEAPNLAARARNTDVYDDQTGATRAGTFAEVAGTDDHARRAAAEVAARNPGHEHLESIAAGELTVVLSAATDYQQYLSIKNGGRHDALGPAMDQGATALHDAAMREIARVLR
jgi:hypothetical protein